MLLRRPRRRLLRRPRRRPRRKPRARGPPAPRFEEPKRARRERAASAQRRARARGRADSSNCCVHSVGATAIRPRPPKLLAPPAERARGAPARRRTRGAHARPRRPADGVRERRRVSGLERRLRTLCRRHRPPPTPAEAVRADDRARDAPAHGRPRSARETSTAGRCRVAAAAGDDRRRQDDGRVARELGALAAERRAS